MNEYCIFLHVLYIDLQLFLKNVSSVITGVVMARAV